MKTSLRSRQLAAIHMLAYRQLRLDEESYRALLERMAGVRSAAVLTPNGRHRVLDELRRLTGEGQRAMRHVVPGAPENVRDELAAMVGKVGAILAETHCTWNYAHGIGQRMFHVRRIEWLTAEQLHRLVSAMSYDQVRRRRRRKNP